jgi:hypothetical protein
MSLDNPTSLCPERKTTTHGPVDLTDPGSNHHHRRMQNEQCHQANLQPLAIYDGKGGPCQSHHNPEVRRAIPVYPPTAQGQQNHPDSFGVKLSRSLGKIGRTIEHGVEAVGEGGEHVLVGAVRGSLGLPDNSLSGPNDHRWSHVLQSVVHEIAGTARSFAPCYAGPALEGAGKLYMLVGAMRHMRSQQQ